MTKHHWFKFYASTWLSDRRVALMSPAQKGVYIDLLALCWQEGSIPSNPDELAFLLRLPKREFGSIWHVVSQHFHPTDDPYFLTNRRLDSERRHAETRMENARKSAKARWQSDANALPTQSERNANQKKSKKKEVEEDKDLAPKAPNDSRRVIEAWEAGWVARFKPADGKAPPSTTADYKHAKNLVATYGIEKAIALVSRFLDDTDKFVAERGHVLRDLPSRIARYAKGDGPLFKGAIPPMAAVEKDETGCL